VLYLTRFVSLSSILASIAFAVFILFIFNEKEPLYRVFAVAVALMVIFTHQKNINRLLKGTESKVPILKYRDKRKVRNSHLD
jgi:glycerol-3-phosphate acyltransferase PlsY